jgi:hypothetical protein
LSSADRPLKNRILLPLALLWSVIVLGVVEWTVGSGLAFRPFFALADPRVGPAGFGALVVHAILCPTDRRKKIVLRTGVALEAARILLLLQRGIAPDVIAFSAGYGFFAAAVADFAWNREWRSAALASLVPIGMASAPLGLAGIVRRLTASTYDGALYALDATLRLPISQGFAGWMAALPPLRALSLITYAALPGAIAAGLAYEEYNYRRGVTRGVGVNLLLAYTLSGSLAAVLYIICPGTGPYHAFPGMFPNQLPDPATVSLSLAPFAPLAPRNAMPSLHFAWAVLLARSTAGARTSVRLIAWAFVLLTIAATIGSGEHYVVDLIAAIPFVIALEATTAHWSVLPSKRVLPLWVGVMLFVIWITIVRGGPVTIPFLRENPAAMWSLSLATILASALVALRHAPAQTKNAEG